MKDFSDTLRLTSAPFSSGFGNGRVGKSGSGSRCCLTVISGGKPVTAKARAMERSLSGLWAIYKQQKLHPRATMEWSVSDSQFSRLFTVTLCYIVICDSSRDLRWKECCNVVVIFVALVLHEINIPIKRVTHHIVRLILAKWMFANSLIRPSLILWLQVVQNRLRDFRVNWWDNLYRILIVYLPSVILGWIVWCWNYSEGHFDEE